MQRNRDISYVQNWSCQREPRIGRVEQVVRIEFQLFHLSSVHESEHLAMGDFSVQSFMVETWTKSTNRQTRCAFVGMRVWKSPSPSFSTGPEDLRTYIDALKHARIYVISPRRRFKANEMHAILVFGFVLHSWLSTTMSMISDSNHATTKTSDLSRDERNKEKKDSGSDFSSLSCKHFIFLTLCTTNESLRKLFIQ